MLIKLIQAPNERRPLIHIPVQTLDKWLIHSKTKYRVRQSLAHFLQRKMPSSP